MADLAQSLGFVPAVVYIVTKTVIAIGLWGVAVIGWLGRPLAVWGTPAGHAAAFTWSPPCR